jgi:hypothetical protein
MRKITAKEAVKGLQLVATQGLVGRFQSHVLFDNRGESPIPEGSVITIVEKPRSYQGSGRCVKFTVGTNLVNRYAFWSDFKNSTILKED